MYDVCYDGVQGVDLRLPGDVRYLERGIPGGIDSLPRQSSSVLVLFETRTTDDQTAGGCICEFQQTVQGLAKAKKQSMPVGSAPGSLVLTVKQGKLNMRVCTRCQKSTRRDHFGLLLRISPVS